MELAEVSSEVGAAGGRPNHEEFRIGDACKDDQLLVVSQAQPEKEERKVIHGSG